MMTTNLIFSVTMNLIQLIFLCSVLQCLQHRLP